MGVGVGSRRNVRPSNPVCTYITPYRTLLSCNYTACSNMENPVILRCHVSAGWDSSFMAKNEYRIVFSSSCTVCSYQFTKFNIF